MFSDGEIESKWVVCKCGPTNTTNNPKINPTKTIWKEQTTYHIEEKWTTNTTIEKHGEEEDKNYNKIPFIIQRVLIVWAMNKTYTQTHIDRAHVSIYLFYEPVVNNSALYLHLAQCFNIIYLTNASFCFLYYPSIHFRSPITEPCEACVVSRFVRLLSVILSIVFLLYTPRPLVLLFVVVATFGVWCGLGYFI